jgi:uncharacterized protein (TIGR02265 family)
MVDRGSAGNKAPPTSYEGRPFVDPPWDAPIDVERALAIIPADSTISGMFFSYLVGAAKAKNHVLPSARDRYLAFNFYPVAELARLVIEAAPLFFPGRSLRFALRTLGRHSPDAFLSSTLGKVTLGSTEGVHAAFAAIANAYELNLRPSRVAIVDRGPTWAVVRIDKVFYFLDSHHVGTFEGIFKFAGVNGTVRIASRSASSADLQLSWDAAGSSTPPTAAR